MDDEILGQFIMKHVCDSPSYAASWNHKIYERFQVQVDAS